MYIKEPEHLSRNIFEVFTSASVRFLKNKDILKYSLVEQIFTKNIRVILKDDKQSGKTQEKLQEKLKAYHERHNEQNLAKVQKDLKI